MVIGRVLGSTLLFALALNVQGAKVTTERKGKDSHVASEDRLKRELEDTAQRMLAIIQNGDPKELLNLVSRDGIELSVDWPAYRIAYIRRDFNKKTGFYCALFDTNCVTRENNEERERAGAPKLLRPVCSYREVLQKATARELKVSVQESASGGWQGDVDISLKKPSAPGYGCDEPVVVHFVFSYEDGKWKLAAMPYY